MALCDKDLGLCGVLGCKRVSANVSVCSPPKSWQFVDATEPNAVISINQIPKLLNMEEAKRIILSFRTGKHFFWNVPRLWDAVHPKN